MAQVPPARTFPDEQRSGLGRLVDHRPLRSAQPGDRILPRDCGRDHDRRAGRCWSSSVGAPRGWGRRADPGAQALEW